MPIVVGLSFGLSIFLRSASVLVSHHIPWVGDLVCSFTYIIRYFGYIFPPFRNSARVADGVNLLRR